MAVYYTLLASFILTTTLTHCQNHVHPEEMVLLSKDPDYNLPDFSLLSWTKLSELYTRLGNSTTDSICIKKLENLAEHLVSKNASLKMESFLFLDAAGKPPTGYSYGNTMFLGSYDVCMNLANFTNGHYKFCQGSTIVGGAYAAVWSGCLPAECVCDNCNVTELKDELVNMINKLDPALNLTLPAQVFLSCEDSAPYDTGAYIAFVVVSIILFLVVVGTVWYAMEPIIQSYLVYRAEYLLDHDQLADNLEPKSIQSVKSMEPNVPDSTLNKLIKCFALQRTWSVLTSTETKPGQVLCLNGIRVLSINWVVLCHMYAFSIGLKGDGMFLITLMERRSFSLVLNGFASVDSFFVMSGFLVSYLLLKQVVKRGSLSPLQWVSYYVHRYLRLTIPFLVVILIQGFLLRHMVSGPNQNFLYAETSDHAMCSDYWWSSILYINNFVPWSQTEMCVGQSWYLSNDFQFYVLAPIFILALFYRPLAGVMLSVGTITASAIAAGVTTYVDKLGPTTSDGKQDDFNLLYTKPWIRITPYLIGIIGGWLYWCWAEKVKEIVAKKPLWLKVAIAVPIWVVTIAIEYAVVFGLHHDLVKLIELPGIPDAVPVVDSVTYQSLGRIAWAIALTVQILACEAGLGGYFNTALSWKGWVFLGRLTYAVYLVHIGLMEIYYVQVRHPIFYKSEYEMSMTYIGILGVSYGVGAILFTFVELPLAFVEAISYRK